MWRKRLPKKDSEWPPTEDNEREISGAWGYQEDVPPVRTYLRHNGGGVSTQRWGKEGGEKGSPVYPSSFATRYSSHSLIPQTKKDLATRPGTKVVRRRYSANVDPR